METPLQHIESHWNSTVVPSILEQYKDSEKWQAMLKAVIDQMQIAEDAAAEFMTVLDFQSEVPTGAKLDFIAGLVNVTRMVGESDEFFYTRFINSLGKRKAGTPDYAIDFAKLLSGDPHPQYMDEAPATFFVYTGPRPVGGGAWEQGGRQLTRQDLRKVAPAGALGLPGAAITTAIGGAFLADAKGRPILAVGHEGYRTLVNRLVDDNGNYIVDDQGRHIIVHQRF